jgi:CubicO group peptidase (beta-lactamase class C family)
LIGRRYIWSPFVATCLILMVFTYSTEAGIARAGNAPAAGGDDGADAQEASEKPPFPEGDATTEGIAEEALQELVKRAFDTNTSALVVLKNGKLIGHWYFGHKVKPLTIRSITKSITSLAIGALIDEHKIDSVDVPISAYYPEWAAGPKRGITLRQILSQTSGLDDRADFSQPDLVKWGLEAELKEKPGTKFGYNDRASNILAGVVQIASGKSLDAYVADRIFCPLAITTYHWDKDQAGNPLAMGGLSMNAIDLAKVGQLIASGGIWEGKQIVSSSWIETATTRPSSNASYGLMWWLLCKTGEAGEGETKDVIGCEARGHLGQVLLILPKQKLVVARQISEKGHKDEADDFSDLPARAEALLRKQ